MKTTRKLFTIMSLLIAFAFVASSASATVLDLTGGGEGTINGAIYLSSTNDPTGTGVYDPFLRLQNNVKEIGFNTETHKYLDNKDGVWTHEIMLSAIPLVTGGIYDGYRELRLDINQVNTGDGTLYEDKRNLSLDQLILYYGPSGEDKWSGDPAYTGSLTTVYEMDLGGDNAVIMNYDLNVGSGGDDLRVYVLDSLFDGAGEGAYFYLYSQFGVLVPSNDGFEEWGVSAAEAPPPPPPVVPEPATLLLLGTGLAGLAAARKRKKGNK